jgi:tetratricopeptide (TPR) repeat protein
VAAAQRCRRVPATGGPRAFFRGNRAAAADRIAHLIRSSGPMSTRAFRALLPLAASLALALALSLGAPAHAQSPAPPQPLPKEEPAPPLPADYDEAARRAHALALGEVRDLINAKRYDDALAKLDPLIAARPREPQTRFLKAIVLADTGRRDDAVAALRAIVADFPELPEPRNNLAVLHAAAGNYALAREELELAIAAAPDYAIAHENLGDVYVRLAAIQFERAAALEPRGKSAPQKLKLARDLLGATR